MNAPDTTVWLPDWILVEESFETGLALVADDTGRIVRLSRQPADLARARRLEGRAMLPGLVNAHSHCHHRVLRGRTELRNGEQRDHRWTWRERLFHAVTSLGPEDLYAAARMAFVEMLLGGITTVGEFHYLHHAPDGAPYANPHEMALALVRAAADTGIRLCLLQAAYARAGWRRTPSAAQRRFLHPDPHVFLAQLDTLRRQLAHAPDPARAWVGVAPHSIDAVPVDYLRVLGQACTALGLPVHMRLSEQTGENEACLAEHDTTPIGLLQRENLLHPNFTAVHAIHVSSHEGAALARAGARVCACPTTERNLGAGIVPADTLQARGIRIALGTDANLQIDLLEDARQLEYHLRLKHLGRALLAPADLGDPGAMAPLAARLLRCATANGADSLHSPGGHLAPGRAADFFTVDLADPALAGATRHALLPTIVFAAGRPAVRDVVVGGRELVRDGRHPQQGEIGAAFAALQRRLWTQPHD